MNQKRKKVQLDQIKQKQNSQGTPQKINKNHLKSSGGQSDFSEFQLGPKDLNNDFSQFKKPKLWDKTIKNGREGQKLKKNKRKHSKRIQKNDEIEKKNIKQAKPENLIPELISFKKTVPQDLQKGEGTCRAKESIKNESKLRENNSENEQLIKEYDKSEFNNKHRRREVEAGIKTLERSRRQQREQQVKNKGVIETAGGICFDVTISEFAFKEEKNKIKKKGASRKNSKNGGAMRKSSKVFNEIEARQQILKRRQIAFMYGEIARRRTFGYY